MVRVLALFQNGQYFMIVVVRSNWHFNVDKWPSIILSSLLVLEAVGKAVLVGIIVPLEQGERNHRF